MRKILFALGLFATSFPVFGQADTTLIGAGVRSRPEYDGSSSRTVDFIPVVRYYGKPFFARTTQGILEGGVRTSLAPGLDLGAQLAYEPGPLDKDPGGSLGYHLEWDGKLGQAPVSLLGRLRHYLDSDRGIRVDLRANAGVYQSGPALVGVFAQFTFANAENTRAYFFGVSESGHLYTDLGVLGSYDLTREWVLVGSFHLRQLNGDITGVQKRSGAHASAGLAHKF